MKNQYSYKIILNEQHVKSGANMNSDPKENKGTFETKESGMGAGIAIGVGVGVAIGTAMGNIGAGLAIGIAVGIAIGTKLQNKKSTKDKDE